MSELFEAFSRNFPANHEAFNRHDFETAFRALPEDAVWEPNPDLVDRERLVGKRAIIEAFRGVTELYPDWETKLVAMNELTPGLVQLRMVGRGTVRGATIETRFVQEWVFRTKPLQIREYPA